MLWENIYVLPEIGCNVNHNTVVLVMLYSSVYKNKIYMKYANKFSNSVRWIIRGDDDLIYQISKSVCIMKKLVSPRCIWLHCQLLNLSIDEIPGCKPDCATFPPKKICVWLYCKITFYRMAWRSAMKNSTLHIVISSQMTNHLIPYRDMNERQHMCLQW